MTTSSLLSPPAGGVLVASPSTSWREQVLGRLYDRRWPVQQVMGGADALDQLESGNWQVLFLDRRLPDLDAEELVEIIQRRFPGTEVVVLDAEGDGAHAVPSRNKGHAQRWLKPFPISFDPSAPACGPASSAAIYASWPGNLTQEQEEEQEQKQKQEEDSDRQQEPGRSHSPATPEPLPGMIGSAPAMHRLYQLARLIAPRLTTVLITGATGTGKELVARAIHRLSPRVARPFIVVNCAAIPEALLESELFGHARGAFTGAVQAYPGRVYAAQGGTLFLDEVGELPLSLQAKLLRFLDQKEVQRLGSTEAVRVDVRVVAATNADLERDVEQGRFRGDLYYRLGAFPLELPGLAERVADILPLAEHFLRAVESGAGKPALRLSPEAARMLLGHGWEGNVRELQQVVERGAILAAGSGSILPSHLYFRGRRADRMAISRGA